MKELLDELTAVDRHVGDGEVPAGAAKVIRLTRTYPARREDLWDALTDPERLARWFLPVSGDLRVGGRYQFEGQAGGVIRQCEPPRRLLVSWEMGPPGPADASLVEVQLTAVDDGTRLDLVHRAQVPPEMWDRFGPGAVGVGWDGALLGLARHLADRDLTIPPEHLHTDPAMRAFYTASAQAWGAAQLAAGANAATVDANVVATTGFYVPPDGA